MSDRPRYTMRQNSYRPLLAGAGPLTVYAMILDTWYCYREVWRLDVRVGYGGAKHAERTVNALAVERLAELEAEHEAWVAAT